MSLISDALKKARQEAALQDAQRQTLPYAVGGTTDSGSRRPAWLPLLAGLGAGCLLAAAVFLGMHLAGRGPADRSARETAQVAEASPAPVPPATADAPAAPTPPPLVEERSPAVLPEASPVPPPAPAATPEPAPVPAAATPAPPVRTQPTPAPAPSQPIVPSTPVLQTTPAPADAAPAPAPTPAPAPETPAAPPADAGEAQSYVREVPVPGGGTVRLDGIAYSPDRPIAVLDGHVIAPGEAVQGYTVVEIQSGRVKLQGHGQTVYVTLK